MTVCIFSCTDDFEIKLIKSNRENADLKIEIRKLATPIVYKNALDLLESSLVLFRWFFQDAKVFRYQASILCE